MDVLRDLVSRTNVYINSRGKDLNVDLVERVARWVGDMLRMFGLGEGETSEIGWGQEQGDGPSAVNVSVESCLPDNALPKIEVMLTDLPQREEVLMPYLRVLSSFRDGVRQLAIANGDGVAKDILALCDKLRDVDAIPLGVAFDDQEGAFQYGSMHECHH